METFGKLREVLSSMSSIKRSTLRASLSDISANTRSLPAAWVSGSSRSAEHEEWCKYIWGRLLDFSAEFFLTAIVFSIPCVDFSTKKKVHNFVPAHSESLQMNQSEGTANTLHIEGDYCTWQVTWKRSSIQITRRLVHCVIYASALKLGSFVSTNMWPTSSSLVAYVTLKLLPLHQEKAIKLSLAVMVWLITIIQLKNLLLLHISTPWKKGDGQTKNTSRWRKHLYLGRYHFAKSQVFFPSRCGYVSCLQVPTNRQQDELNSSSYPLESSLRSSWLCTRPFVTPRNGRVGDLSLEEQFNEARPWYNVVRLMNHSIMSFLAGSRRTLREDSGNQRCLSGI